MLGLLLAALAAQLELALATGPIPDGVMYIPLIRIKNQTSYGVEFQVGTPPQINVLEMDTGSPTIGFETPGSNECLQANAPCAMYGSYDNTSSSSAVFVESGYNDLLVNQGFGSFINDTLVFGGVSYENVMFGTLEQVDANFYLTAPDAGIFGVGQLCETDNNCTTYPTLIQQLYDRGALSTRAYSVYLGPDNPNVTGSLILAGRDRAKIRGEPFTVPMVTPDSNAANHSPNWLNYSSIAFTSPSGNTTTFTPTPAESASLVDTGTPQWYLPPTFWPAVRDYFNVSASLGTIPPFVVDCAYREPAFAGAANITVEFGSGNTIDIPMHRLVTLGEPDASECTLQLGGNGMLFGAPFIRQAYITYNLDDLSMTLGNVRFTEDADIVALGPSS